MESVNFFTTSSDTEFHSEMMSVSFCKRNTVFFFCLLGMETN